MDDATVCIALCFMHISKLAALLRYYSFMSMSPDGVCEPLRAAVAKDTDWVVSATDIDVFTILEARSQGWRCWQW